MKKIVIILSVLFSTAFLSCEESSAQVSKLLEPQEMVDVLASKDVHLVDVRTPKEFNQGFIENAVNIDFMSPNFKEEIKKLESNKPIVVYCRSGRRSGISIKHFVDAGFTEIYDLKGGVLNWQKKGMRLVKK